MSSPHGRVFASHTITTKALIGFSLLVMVSICTQLMFPGALAAPIVSDNFNDNSIDPAKWDANLFSGFTNTNVPLAEISQQLEIGPLLTNEPNSAYRGVRTLNTYNFSGAYSFVELVKAPDSNSTGFALFTVGNNVDNYYRIYVSGGTLFGEKKIAGTKSPLFSISYDLTNHRFLRIRHDATTGNVTLDTAPGNGGLPGNWVQRYTETWNTSISTSAIIFEVKGGTSGVQQNTAPGKVIFDNFEVGSNSSPAPTVTAISPTSGSTSGGTSVTITGTGFSSGATVSLGGTAATNVTVVSSTSITATTSAHAAGTVNVVVTNTDSQNGTLTSGYTYSASAPTVTAISPTSGSTSGGTSVSITGTGFSPGATVSLGGTAATNVTVVSSTSITATTPAHAAGTVNVMVTNTDSQNGTLSSGYTYSSPDASAFVRILTGNVQHGVGTDGATNYTRQTNILTRDTDIVCLQERTTGDTGWNAGMAAQGFTEVAYRENDSNQRDGPSIWVRTSTVTVNGSPFTHALSTGAIGWDGSTTVDKAAVAVKVTVAGRQFYVVNTHLCWSACADSQGSHFSVTRVNQINELLNWINTTLTGGLDVLIVGDMNFGPEYPKNSASAPAGITTQRGIFLADYDDLWEQGVNTGKATALWPDRNGDGVLDMPITVLDSGGNNTRTHDERRIDYAFLKKTASTLALHNIDLPDLRAGCSGVTEPTGFADDLGVRPSDHNWIKLTLRLN
jgi:endonuclease/exonuclease/phosphatase family metal-dependent hydrolase